MIFAKLDVSVYAHRRFAEAGFEAVGYWALILAYLRHQESEDGFLSSQLIGVPLGAGREACLPLCEKLVSAGLFRKTKDGYFLVNYAEKNETKDEIEVRKTATRTRKATYRKSVQGKRGTPLSHVPEGGAVPRPFEGDSPAPPTALLGRGTADSDSSSLSDSDSGSDSESPSPSPSGSGSVSEGEAGAPGNARRPLPLSERALSGPAWLAAFCEGISAVTKRPCTAGRMYLGTLERIVSHHAPFRDAPRACAWLRDEAKAFAKKWDGKHPAKGLTPDGLERWLNEGRGGPPDFGPKRIVQLSAEEWHGDDFSDFGAKEAE